MNTLHGLILNFSFKVTALSLLLFAMPESAHATQMHSASEGVIVHQIGHLFFLVSMVILYLTIKGKSLNLEKGWKFIQLSALLFVLWNLNALLVHFFDNQIDFISTVVLSMWEIEIKAVNNSPISIWLYYFLRLDHLLALPAMILLWKGLDLILKKEISAKEQKDMASKDHNTLPINGQIDSIKGDIL
ncbi:MAG: hypothetical protein HQK65_09695 [Desulfamplus sp.]|nr:hypothetical protein [Desulfamplus sp.]